MSISGATGTPIRVGTAGGTLSERLAAYVLGLRYEEIPTDALMRMKTTLVHDIVVGALGRGTDEARAAVALIRSDFGASGPCAVIGERERASANDAAFANAVLMRTLRQEDTVMPAGIHAGAIAFPVALALAETHGRSGREVVTALVAGFDVGAALDRCSPSTRQQRTASHVYGAFVSAAVAARLLGLDLTRTAAALAYAGDLGTMVMSGFGDTQYGILARNGMLAAHLARAGAPAAADTLESVPGFFAAQVGRVPSRDEIDAALAPLGREFAVRGSTLKLFPGALANAVAVAIATRLVRDHGLRAEDVTAVTVRRPAESNDHLKLAKGPFASPQDATSSVAFAIAAVLMDGTFTLERLSRCNDPDVLELTHRVDIVPIDHQRDLYHRIELRTRRGVLTGEGDQRLIVPADPHDMVRQHAGRDVDHAWVDAVAEAVERLDTAADVTGLTRLLRDPTRPPRRSRRAPRSAGAPRRS